MRVDRGDNIWIADKGSDLVVRFDPQGRVSMVFGRKAEASDESAHPLEHPKPPLPPVDGMFRQVTDVTWDSDGNIYIADGYINSRIARYDQEGNWLGSWGEPGSGPGQFNTPHAILADRQDRIYVADRGNARVQVFDPSGKLLQIISYRVPPPPADAPVAIGNRPAEAGSGNPRAAITSRCSRARPGRCALPQGLCSIFMSPMPTRAASTSCRSMARCWAGSAVLARH